MLRRLVKTGRWIVFLIGLYVVVVTVIEILDAVNDIGKADISGVNDMDIGKADIRGVDNMDITDEVISEIYEQHGIDPDELDQMVNPEKVDEFDPDSDSEDQEMA